MNLQNDLDALEMKIANERHSINQLEGLLSGLDEKRKAAKELKAYAEDVRSKPAVFGVNGSSHTYARYDLEKAEEVLAKVTHSYGPAEERLRRCKVYLEGLLEQKKAFPLDKLREERRVERLRASLI
jgi:hypothetical protein